MDDTTLISEGFSLMLIGMGFVFVFLAVLVIVTSLMSWIITRYEKSVGTLPDEGIPAPTAVIGKHNADNLAAQPPHDHTLLTVLSGAVHKYRNRNK
jgi:oxaloacetate decarboxylase gamma subunit